MLRGKVIRADDAWYVLNDVGDDGTIHVYYLNDHENLREDMEVDFVLVRGNGEVEAYAQFFLLNVMELEKYLESIGGVIDWRNSTHTNPNVFDVDKGWYPLIQNLIQELIELGWDKQITQVKEKFGGLRFYVHNANEEMNVVINKYEKLSYETCETCGDKGEIRRDIGWWRTLCDKHYEERKG